VTFPETRSATWLRTRGQREWTGPVHDVGPREPGGGHRSRGSQGVASRSRPSHHFSVLNLMLNLSDEGDYLPVTQNLVDSLDFWFVILSHPEEDQLMRDVAAVRELERRLVAGEPAVRLG
jgi:hypothetical protein